MATFAFKPQYTYMPTPLHSKNTAICHRSVPKQVSIFDKLQQIRLSSTSFSTLWSVASAMTVADDDKDYRPRIQGMIQDEEVFNL